jgi:hypothetical protein
MRIWSLTLVAALFPIGAIAQPSQPGGAPLVVERIHNAVVLAPEYKITEIDDRTGQLAGGYVGWLGDDQLLIGGAAYWLANGDDDFGLTYGGLLVGWSMPPERRIQFGARSLVGFGRATLGTDLDVTRSGDRGRNSRIIRFGARTTELGSSTIRVAFADDVFVFEPEVTVLARLARHVGLAVRAGYRVTGFTDALSDRLNGPAASVALQFGLK